jgi:hypothetical protein
LPPAPRRPPRRRPAPPAEPEATSADADDDRAAFVIELSTAGPASGALQGGLFLGGRLSRQLVLGAGIDIEHTSVDITTGGSLSSTTFTLSPGVRYTFASTNDGRVDIFGAGDAGIVYTSADVVNDPSMPAQSASTFGFTLAAGPGLRVWIFDHLAVGYLARLRFTHASGGAGAAPGLAQLLPPDTNVSATTFGFDGTFQILGVF